MISSHFMYTYIRVTLKVIFIKTYPTKILHGIRRNNNFGERILYRLACNFFYTVKKGVIPNVRDKNKI